MEIGLEVDVKSTINNSVIQQLKILQYSYLEIYEEIKREFQENPILEIEENNVSIEEILYTSEKRMNRKNEKSEESNFLEKEYNKSLGEYIIEQTIIENTLDSRERHILEIISYSIDNTGYLNCSLKNLEELYQIEESEFEKILKLIHNIEPKGLGAKDLRECLELQLKEKDKYYKLTKKIINEYLNLVASNNLETLSKKLDISIDIISYLVGKIKNLNPKPGYNIETRHENIIYLYPEIKLREEKEGFEVLIKENYYPKIYINKEYEKILLNNENIEGIEFLKTRYKRAVNLVRNIQKRRETLKKVVDEIVREQKGFFENNTDIKTLSLKDIAEKLDIHQSTVSRTIKNKYIETPKGIYSLKFFFSNYSIGVEKQSYIFLSNKIKEIVDNEKKSNPLSDEKIKEELLKIGINISRRTITKYREKEGILSSKKRRTF